MTPRVDGFMLTISSVFRGLVYFRRPDDGLQVPIQILIFDLRNYESVVSHSCEEPKIT